MYMWISWFEKLFENSSMCAEMFADRSLLFHCTPSMRPFCCNLTLKDRLQLLAD
jgi:hypothetical protein